jgi:hypothetical protein
MTNNQMLPTDKIEVLKIVGKRLECVFQRTSHFVAGMRVIGRGRVPKVLLK